MSEVKTVATHSGPFHCDEVMAFSIIKKVYGDQIQLIRSRDEAEITKADIVIDVGAIYDPDKMRFDHHQPGGAGQRVNGIPYSSAGLVWKHLGPKVVESQEEWQSIDEKLIQGIDSLDCGIKTYTGDRIVKTLSLSNLIGLIRPTWQESNDLEDFDKKFLEAVKITDMVLERSIQYTRSHLEAQHEVDKAIQESQDGIMILDQYMPWKEHVLNSQQPKAKGILFCLTPNVNDDWCCTCAITESGSYECRKQLPESWAGLRNEQLQAITGIPDAKFCHPSRFICGAKSREGIINIAKKAIGG